MSDRLRQLAAQLPPGLQSDWETNHYELKCSLKDYWWLMVGDGITTLGPDPTNTLEGQRLGLLMDIAAEVGRMRDSGEL